MAEPRLRVGGIGSPEGVALEDENGEVAAITTPDGIMGKAQITWGKGEFNPCSPFNPAGPARGDGVTDDTASVQEAINLAKIHTNPPGQNQRGNGVVTFPKGRFYVGSLDLSLSRGLVVRGAGEDATVLIFPSDSGTMFNLQRYGPFIMENLSIMHEGYGNLSNRDNWDNVCFNLDGTGGGRAFTLRNVTTYGFGTLIRAVKVLGNNDTNYLYNCTFNGGNTFLYVRNNEAVINRIEGCSWTSEWRKVFDVTGFGYTTVANGNFLVAGTILTLHDDNQDSIVASRYVFDNCKVEFRPFSGSTVRTTKIIDLAPDAYAAIDMRNCGFSGGGSHGTIDPSVYHLDFQSSRVTFTADRCYFDEEMKVRVGASTHTNYWAEGAAADWNGPYFIKFVDCDRVPPPENIEFMPASGQAGRAAVVYQRCARVNDVTITDTASSSHIATHAVSFSTGPAGQLHPGGGKLEEHSTYDLYGRPTLLKGITVLVDRTISVVGGGVDFYSDAERTNLIASLDIDDGTTEVPKAYPAEIPAGTVIDGGLYLTMRRGNNGLIMGKILLEYANF